MLIVNSHWTMGDSCSIHRCSMWKHLLLLSFRIVIILYCLRLSETPQYLTHLSMNCVVALTKPIDVGQVTVYLNTIYSFKWNKLRWVTLATSRYTLALCSLEVYRSNAKDWTLVMLNFVRFIDSMCSRNILHFELWLMIFTLCQQYISKWNQLFADVKSLLWFLFFICDSMKMPSF